MKNCRIGSRLWLFVFGLALSVGCSSTSEHAADAGKKDENSTASATTAKTDESASAAADAPKTAFKLGDMLELFDPPPLAELDKTAEWIEGPVVDGLERLRLQKEKEPPLVTVDEALAMKNDSPEANKKILSALSVLAPKDGKGVNWEAPLKRALITDLHSMNPLLASSVSEQEITDLTGFGLFGYDWNMIPFASKDAVVSWQTSKDHLIDKVVLRDDLVWSDGEPITAQDVEFSFKLIMTNSVPIPAVRTGVDEIRWVKAYDDHTLVYFQKRSLSTNIWNLNFPIVPKHIYEKSAVEDPTLRTSDFHRKLERNPITGGAYSMESWSRGQEIVLKRREDYYMYKGKQVRDKPYFAEMRFRIIEDGNTRLLALKSGDIEASELEPEQWQTQSEGADYYRENTKVYGPEWLYMYIGWNMDTKKVPYFGDVRVRKAMAYALNYDEMLKDLCYGLYEQCTGIFHPDSWMYPKTPLEHYHQDLDKAENLLDEAGWKDTDGDGIRDKVINGKKVPFEFTLLVSNKPERIAICNLFRENLNSIGIQCNVQPLEAAVFQERVFDKNYEAEMAGWGTGTDPSLEKNIFGTGEGRNAGSYSNPQVDKLLQQGMTEFDRDKQAEIYGRVHTLIFEDQPYLFLYNIQSLYGFNKTLRGYRFSPRGPFSYSPGIGAIWTP